MKGGDENGVQETGSFSTEHSTASKVQFYEGPKWKAVQKCFWTRRPIVGNWFNGGGVSIHSIVASFFSGYPNVFYAKI